MNQKAGNWKPYPVLAIVSNIESVFKHRDIRKLNKPSYEFITLCMGFIAHDNLYGFQEVYTDLREFCVKLQTSEYSRDKDSNLKEANRVEKDRDFLSWYGEAYCKSKAEAIRKSVALARKYEKEVSVHEADRDDSIFRLLQECVKRAETDVEFRQQLVKEVFSS